MARDGLGILIGTVLFAAVMIWGALTTSHFFLDTVAVVSALLVVFVAYFFRDPERAVPADSRNVVSPADGKVVEIEESHEGEFMNADATRVAIFLNIFDVHVNRVPISGKVSLFRYQKGSFVSAFKAEASEVNEQTIIGIENGERRLLFKQIAGLIARRIVCTVREGNNVQLGERCGIIKFGSRVDIFLPKSVKLQVKLGQKVKGGESIIGVFTDEV